MNLSQSNCEKAFCCPKCTQNSNYLHNIHRHVERRHKKYYNDTYIKTLTKVNRIPPKVTESTSPPINNDSAIKHQPEQQQQQQQYREKVETEPNRSSNKKLGIIVEAGKSVASKNDLEEIIDTRLIPSFKIVIYGPSRSGKTLLVKDLLTNLDRFTEETPKKIVLIYTVWQPAYDKMKNEELIDTFIQDNNDLEAQLSNFITGEEVLFIFDDMVNSKNITYISDLFMVQGRHKNISLIFISQQGFRNNDAFRSISNNTNYIILMKNDRNILEIQNMAKQMTPGAQPLMMQIYKKATTNQYSYLFINFTHECSKKC